MLRAVFVVLAFLAGLFLIPHQPAPADSPVVAAKPADSVQVDRRLITVELAAVEPTKFRPRPAQTAAVVTKKARLVKRTDTSPKPFVERAARFVLGDGRFRPAPFPRPSR